MSEPSLITAIRAREVLDCRGLPTVQVDLELEGGVTGTADVPSGRSTGSNEAHELRDGGDRFGGFGVRDAVANVTGEIARGAGRQPSCPTSATLDAALIELDGTAGQVAARRQRDPRRLAGGGARPRAPPRGCRSTAALNANAHMLPVPLVNLINGGKHASNDLDFQEFIVIPVGAELDPRGAADLDRGQPRAGRDPARALRQERPQHRRRGRLRAGDLQPAGGARAAARGGRRRRPRGPLPLRARLRRDPLLRPRRGTYLIAGETPRHRRDDRALPAS